MTFEEWEKEHSSEICPHTPKQLGYTVTRCRTCVWDAAQKEMAKEYLKELEGGEYFGISVEGRLEAIKYWLKNAESKGNIKS